MRWAALPLLAVVLAHDAAWAALSARDEAVVQAWIHTHAQRGKVVEAPATRLGVTGDLDGDGRADAAVLYTLQSGGAQRGERRYLAVFRRHRDGLRLHAHVLVGGSGAAEANRATILDKTVVVELLTHRAGDAACCPTRPAIRRYRLATRGLTVVREAGRPASQSRPPGAEVGQPRAAE